LNLLAENIDRELASAEFVADPYRLYRRLREDAPVCWSHAWRCWLLTRHEDVIGTLNDPDRFGSNGRLTAVFEAELSPDFQEQIRPLIRHYNTGLINVDGADHSRMRRLVQHGFTPAAIGRLKEKVRNVVGRLLGAAAGRQEIDFIREFAYPLPITVITELMGIPEADRNSFKEWSGAVVRFMATPRPTQATLLASNAALVQMRARFNELAQERKQQPRDDLISALVLARDAGDRLSDEEMVSTLTTILIGGHETTTNLLGTSLLRLHQHPGQSERLRSDPTLLPNAVEELLRFDSPFQRNRRVVRVDCELRGQVLRRGEIVLQFLGAANRDPAVYARPEELDLSRTGIRHVSFGHGAHFCLGAALARMEVQVALQEILTAGWRVEVLEERPSWKDGLLRGLMSLRCRVRAAD
jgi:cytochrome P450